MSPSPGGWRRLELAGALLLLWAPGVLAGEPLLHHAASLDYVLTIDDPTRPIVRVEARLGGLDPTETALYFALPASYAFVSLPEPLLDGPLRIGGDAPLSLEPLGPFFWQTPPSGASEVVLRYRVPLDHRRLNAVKEANDQYEFPYLAKDHGLLVTPALLVIPGNVQPDSIRLRLELPHGWRAIAPWPRLGGGDDAPLFALPSLRSAANDLIAIGKWETATFTVGGFRGHDRGGAGTEATPGRGAPADPADRRARARLLRTARAGALPLPLRPARQPGRGRGAARPLDLAFGRPAFPAGRGPGGLAPGRARVLPHLVLRPLPGAERAPLVRRGLHRLLRAPLHRGAGSPDLGGILRPACGAGAGVRGEPPARPEDSLVEAGGEPFFTSGDALGLVYGGGTLLAAWLDAALGGRMDDLVRAFVNDPRWDPYGEAPTLDDLAARLPAYLDPPAAGASAEGRATPRTARFLQWVHAAYDFDPIAAFASLGIEVRREPLPPSLEVQGPLRRQPRARAGIRPA